MRPRSLPVALSGGALLTVALLAAQPTPVNATMPAPKPPVAKKVPHEEVVFGDRRVDDYSWLREKDSAEVVAYLDAENAYADAVMAPTKALEDRLYGEMLGRIKETDLSVPYRDGGWYYYSRTEKGKQYAIQCRMKGSLDAPEEVILDLNALAEGKEFLGLGDKVPSDDGNLLAFSTDTTGFREYMLQVKDLRTGVLGPEQIPKVSSVAWAADGKTLFYVVDDSAKRPYRLYRHVLDGAAPDDLVYEEADEMFALDISRSRSKAYLFLHSGSLTASEVRFLRADAPSVAFQTISAREKDHEYDVDHRGDLFYIRTNSGGRNFRLVTAPVADPRRANWKEMIPHRGDVMLEAIDLFEGHYVAFEREGGLPRLRVIDFATGASQPIEFPEPVYSASPETNHEFAATTFRYSYQSFKTPASVYDYDVRAQTSTLLKRTEVLGGYDPSQYESERMFATAADGARIPISIVARKGLARRDGTNPLMLLGYGAYGISSSVTFSSNRVSLLDRGVVFGIAHIRGGGEMGKVWHDQGRMMSKTNTFTDFIAAAEHLVAAKVTSPDRLAIIGRSAGGLLMGAVANMRPDLFRVVVAGMPFVDVVNTMRDASLPLTAGEFEEWGNPRVKDEYDYMKAYCPYTNVAPRAYPAMLIKTSFNDSQVMYWEPAKWVAKLRANKTDDAPLVFKVNMAGGHGGSSGRYDKLHDDASEYAFLLTELGITK